MTSIIFFFSSRRRHTRWPRDWSSDVCSSDLAAENAHRVHPDLPLAASLSEALDGSHVTVLLTEWEEFQAAQPEALGALVSRRRVLDARHRSEEHTSELQSRGHLVCRLLLEKKKKDSA